jgi:peptide deformylase
MSSSSSSCQDLSKFKIIERDNVEELGVVEDKKVHTIKLSRSNTNNTLNDTTSIKKHKKHKKEKKKSNNCLMCFRCGWLSIFIVLPLVMGLAGMVSWYVLVRNSTFDTQQTVFVPNPIITYHPRKDGCLLMNASFVPFMKDIDPEWKKTYDSMTYWMNNITKMDAISSFNVNSPYCFIMLRQANGELLSLYNPVITGYSKSSIVTRNERSLSCNHEQRSMDRSNMIFVEFHEESQGLLMINRFKNQQAWAIQAMYAYLMGSSICDYTDNGVHSLDKWIHTK